MKSRDRSGSDLVKQSFLIQQSWPLLLRELHDPIFYPVNSVKAFFKFTNRLLSYFSRERPVLFQADCDFAVGFITLLVVLGRVTGFILDEANTGVIYFV